MQTTAHIRPQACLPAGPAGLPGDRAEWPDDARASFRELVGELDRWCRDHQWPPSGNARIAEEAIRRCW